MEFPKLSNGIWKSFLWKTVGPRHCHYYSEQQQHPFNGPLSGTTQVSQYQKGKTDLDFLEQEIVSGSCVSWALCKSAPCPRQVTTLAFHHSVFFAGQMPFLLCNQQRESTEG